MQEMESAIDCANCFLIIYNVNINNNKITLTL